MKVVLRRCTGGVGGSGDRRGGGHSLDPPGPSRRLPKDAGEARSEEGRDAESGPRCCVAGGPAGRRTGSSITAATSWPAV